MDARTAQLLTGLIRHYIDSVEPVSSASLKRELGLPVSSATIRSLLHELEDEGFLEQPHASAGRVPTDKGYRYYVDHMPARRTARVSLTSSPQRLVRHLSRHTHTLAVTALANGRVEQYGLVEFMVQPEGCLPEPLQEVSQFLDGIHDYVERLAEIVGTSPRVFIGAENPCMPAAHTSVIVRTLEDEQDRSAVVAIIGPKRMAYPRNISLLERLHQIEL